MATLGSVVHRLHPKPPGLRESSARRGSVFKDTACSTVPLQVHHQVQASTKHSPALTEYGPILPSQRWGAADVEGYLMRQSSGGSLAPLEDPLRSHSSPGAMLAAVSPRGLPRELSGERI